jgi:two-component system response regulator
MLTLNPVQGDVYEQRRDAMTGEEIEVVLVEDNPNDAELILRALKKHKLANNIVCVEDGAEALEFLFHEGRYADRRSNVPRVVLLDIKLPKIDGIEVLRQMKADPRTREIPVVVLTSSNQEQDIKAAYELGVNSFITKPINFEEFARVVAELGVYWLMLNVPPIK